MLRLALLTTLGVLGFASAASAATLSYDADSGVLTYTGTGSQVDVMVVTAPAPADGNIRLSGLIPGQLTSIPSGCTSTSSATSTETITCTLTGLNELVANLGGGDDRVEGAQSPVDLILRGGPGTDRLTGGPIADTIDGGDDPDVLAGGPGADTLFARDGAAEAAAVDCGDGDDTVLRDDADQLTGCERADAPNPPPPAQTTTVTQTVTTPAPTPVPPPDTKAPNALVVSRDLPRATLRKSGALVLYSCNEACRLSVVLKTNGRTLGKATSTITAAGVKQFTVKVSKDGAKLLKRSRAYTIALVATVTDAAGNTARATSAFTATR